MRRKAFAFVRGLPRLTALPVCLGLAAVSFASASGSASQDPAAAVLKAATSHLADTYVWGAAGPTTWDCSGLTSVLWREVGGVKAIPRTSREQQAWAVPLPKEQALPGDLVFFGDPVSHVGLIETRTKTKKHGLGLQMIDASSSNKGVVEREVWSTGTVRFGRVPRRGMVAVKPWTPPAPPVVAPEVPLAPTTAVALPKALITATANGVGLLAGLPAVSKPGSKVATKAAKLARGWVGNKVISDVDLVRNVWHKAGGAVLPSTREAFNGRGKPVAVKDARVGDLVVYAAPGSHVGIYAGNGLMIDASRSLGKVVVRKVWANPTVRILRLSV